MAAAWRGPALPPACHGLPAARLGCGGTAWAGHLPPWHGQGSGGEPGPLARGMSRATQGQPCLPSCSCPPLPLQTPPLETPSTSAVSQGRTSHTAISAFLSEPREFPMAAGSCPPGEPQLGTLPPPSDTHPGSGTRRWEHKPGSRGTQDTLRWLPTLRSLARGGHRSVTHSSRSLSRKATRKRFSSSESISAGASSSPRGLQRSWDRDGRGGGSTTELPGQPEAPAAPGIFLARLRAPLRGRGAGYRECTRAACREALALSPQTIPPFHPHSVPSSPQTPLQPLRTLHSGSMLLQRPPCPPLPVPLGLLQLTLS